MASYFFIDLFGFDVNGKPLFLKDHSHEHLDLKPQSCLKYGQNGQDFSPSFSFFLLPDITGDWYQLCFKNRLIMIKDIRAENKSHCHVQMKLYYC